MPLLIDIGNTRIKWARFAQGTLHSQSAEPHANWSAQTFGETVLHPGGRDDRVLVSNVSGPRMADIVRAAVAQTWLVEPEFVTSSATAGGVRNAYRQPQQLGVDRWLAIIGQTTAVLVVYAGLDFPLPIWACLAVIALSAWLNIALRLRFRMTQRLEPDRAAWLLAFDIAELAVLLFLTGGLQNPFAFLFLGPVLLSATALPPRFTLMLGAFAVLCATVLVFVHYPLPWDSDDPLQLPPIYMMGVWLSILLAIGFIGVYAWQITEESRQLSDALAATELVLAHEQHLSQLDGLAAAAAHELGTPLSTISVIAKELERAIARMPRTVTTCACCREQATRCRTFLPSSPGILERRAIRPHAADGVIEEVVAPHRNFGVTIDVTTPKDRGSERSTRAISHSVRARIC